MRALSDREKRHSQERQPFSIPALLRPSVVAASGGAESGGDGADEHGSPTVVLGAPPSTRERRLSVAAASAGVVASQLWDEEGGDSLDKLAQIREVLERWQLSGINRKLQFKPCKWKTVKKLIRRKKPTQQAISRSDGAKEPTVEEGEGAAGRWPPKSMGSPALGTRPRVHTADEFQLNAHTTEALTDEVGRHSPTPSRRSGMLYFDRLAQSEARHGAVSGPLLVVPSSLLLGSPSSLANLFGENSGSGSASTDGSASPIIRIKNLDTGVSYPLLGKPLCQLPTLQKQHPPTSPNGGTNLKKQLLRRFSFSDTLQKDQHKTPARHRSNTVEADIPKRDALLRRFSFGNSSTEKKTVNADGTQAGADQQHRDRLSMSRAVGVDDDDNDGDEWEDVEVEVEEVC